MLKSRKTHLHGGIELGDVLLAQNSHPVVAAAILVGAPRLWALDERKGLDAALPDEWLVGFGKREVGVSGLLQQKESAAGATRARVRARTRRRDAAHADVYRGMRCVHMMHIEHVDAQKSPARWPSTRQQLGGQRRGGGGQHIDPLVIRWEISRALTWSP